MNKQKGLTLVEILAAVVIVSLVFTLVIGIAVNSQNFFKRAQSDNLSTADMTVLLNRITSEVRSNPDRISVRPNELLIEPDSGQTINYRFDSSSSALLRNDVFQYNDISDFDPSLENNILSISIKDSKSEVWETKIVLRRGTNER